MSDKNVVHMGENSPEYIAYKLMHHVIELERRSLNPATNTPGWTAADRSYLLATYAECLQAVQMPGRFAKT